MLKRSAAGIVLVLSALAAATLTSAQAPAPALPPCPASVIDGREAKWFRHEFGILSICLPDLLVRKKTERCGENCSTDAAT